MSKEFGTDPKKMLNWNKMLNKQSDYVKNAIEPLITVEFLNNKDFNENNNINEDYNKKQWEKLLNEDPISVKKYFLKSCEVVDLFNHLSNDGVFKGDEKPIVEKLKSLGIKGCIHHDRTDIYNDEYLKKLDIIHENNFKFNWKYTDELPGLENFIGEYLVCDLGKDNHNLDSYFVVGRYNEPGVVNTTIYFFKDGESIEDHKPIFAFDSPSGFKNVKKDVEYILDHFNNIEINNFDELKDYTLRTVFHLPLTQTSEKENNISLLKLEPSQSSNHDLKTANKTGYVQGVCESVLAFNTDENRKIMSEAAMSLLSKKILSEMNVTKDMAQKFANPETYKALEQCVFAPKQEQHLEQTKSQSQGLSI